MRNGSRETTTSPLRVFLVEDSQIIRERLTEALSSPGRIEVVGWAEGEATALEALRRGGWDAVVLDLQLRQGSGFGVLKAVRNAGRPAGSVVIVLTSYPFPLYRVKSEQLGADFFFDKSREYERVRDVLESVADRRLQAGGS